MPREHTSEYVIECFWPGVGTEDLRALDERVDRVVAELVRAGEQVDYRGSILMRADEVVLCVFEGSERTVRKTAERAKIPFERILETARSPWPEDTP